MASNQEERADRSMGGGKTKKSTPSVECKPSQTMRKGGGESVGGPTELELVGKLKKCGQTVRNKEERSRGSNRRKPSKARTKNSEG